MGEAPKSPPVTHTFTTSEFPRLARDGFEIAKAGAYTVKVSCPKGQSWSLKTEGSALTLTPKRESGDASPRWLTVGVSELPKADDVKVIVTAEPKPKPKGEDEEKDKEKKDKPKTKPKSKDEKPKVEQPPLPGLLTLSLDPSYEAAAALDLTRARPETLSPPDDPRRAPGRTNRMGANFEPPATLGAWRGRAREVREQLLVTLGLWPAPPKTPLKPRVFGKLERDGYTIEKVVLETLPGFTLSGNLYRPRGPLRAGDRPCSRPTGTTPRGGCTPTCSTAASAGRSSASWSSCTTWWVTTTASRSAMLS